MVYITVQQTVGEEQKLQLINYMKISNKKIKEIKGLVTLIIVAFTIKTCLLEIYVVPTGSMEKTILIGDVLVGNKFIFGMKTPTWIGIPYTRYGFDIPWFRLPEFRKVKQGDVTIFEFPRDPFQKYVKNHIKHYLEIEDQTVFHSIKEFIRLMIKLLNTYLTIII